jgi:hypothetical protein
MRNDFFTVGARTEKAVIRSPSPTQAPTQAPKRQVIIRYSSRLLLSNFQLPTTRPTSRSANTPIPQKKKKKPRAQCNRAKRLSFKSYLTLFIDEGFSVLLLPYDAELEEAEELVQRFSRFGLLMHGTTTKSKTEAMYSPASNIGHRPSLVPGHMPTPTKRESAWRRVALERGQPPKTRNSNANVAFP